MQFGTDGIRGSYGTVITESLGRQLGAAVARVLGSGAVLVASDTRPSSPRLEEAICAGLLDQGARPIRLGVLPTPALSARIVPAQARGGIMITASHNPPEDNGFKVLDATGAKLNSQARKKLVLEPPGDSPQALPAFESDGAAFYTEQLCRLLGPISPCLVVVDCANGAARQTAPMALKALGLQVKSIYTGDGAAINQHCGALYPQALAAQLGSADFGIALDGDGDRGILILPGGQILDGDDLLFLIASRLPEGAGCVGTIMSNGGLEQSLYAHRQRFFRAPVGDAYVAERMRQEGALLGGEPSGHLLFFGEGGLPTADGLVACLLAIQALQSGVRLDWQRLPQENRSVRVDPARIDMLKPEILALEQAGARVVVRASGTEPVVRVMVEHPQQELAKACVERLCGLLNP